MPRNSLQVLKQSGVHHGYLHREIVRQRMTPGLCCQERLPKEQCKTYQKAFEEEDSGRKAVHVHLIDDERGCPAPALR